MLSPFSHLAGTRLDVAHALQKKRDLGFKINWIAGKTELMLQLRGARAES